MHYLNSLLLSAMLLAGTSLSGSSTPPQRSIDSQKPSISLRTNDRPTHKAPQRGTKLPALHKSQRNTPFYERASKSTLLRGQIKKQLPPAIESTEGIPPLNGLLMYSGSMSYPGLVQMPVSDGADFKVLHYFNEMEDPYYSFEYDGTFYVHVHGQAFGFSDYYMLYGYDTTTGQMVVEEDITTDYFGADAAVDPTTGAVYALTFSDTDQHYNLSLVEYSRSSIKSTVVAELERTYGVLACDSHGQLYAIDFPGNLYKIDKTNGKSTLVGSTGIEMAYFCSATIDPKTDRMYWSASLADQSMLVEIDLNTAAPKLIRQFPGEEEIGGLYAVFSPDANAPAAVTNLKADFPDGSLSGTVSFDAPTTLIGGDKAEGSFDYTIRHKYTTLVSGSAAYGSKVSEDITVDAPGVYEFTVTVKNASGEGPRTNVSLFVGKGVPATPAGVSAVEEDCEVEITWQAVEASADGGFINPAEITYDVIRMPGDVNVAKGITALSCTDRVPAPAAIDKYVYYVYANYSGLKSVPGASNVLCVGTMPLPWSAAFKDLDSLDDFTIIDVNGDDVTWILHSGTARIGYTSNSRLNDWFISPALQLEAGKRYSVTYNISCESANFPERFELCYGNKPQAAAMSEVLIEPTVVNSTLPRAYGATIVPAVSGKYYIGCHAISDPDSYYLKIHDISVTGALESSVPSGVTDFKVEPGHESVLHADISFTAPTGTTGGEELQSLTKIELKRGSELIKTFTAPAPGSPLTFSDVVPASGTYLYSATAYNSNGAGPSVDLSVYIGAGKPAAPANIVLTESYPGTISLNWDPVATDENGRNIPASDVTYNIYGMDGFIAADGLTATTYTEHVCEPGDQGFAQYYVAAVTAAGRSEAVITPCIAVGTAYADYHESFPNASPTFIFSTDSDASARWLIANDALFSNLESADGDDGFIYMTGDTPGATASVYTGKLAVPEHSPAFTFQTFAGYGDEEQSKNLIQVYASLIGGEEVKIFEKTVEQIASGQEGWVKAVADLEQFAGKEIIIRLQASIVDLIYVPVDDLRVCSLADHDLAVTRITVPETVRPGEILLIEVCVRNDGAKVAEGHNLEVYVNDEMIEDYPCDPLNPEANFSVTVSYEVSPLTEENISIYAEIRYRPDEVPDNNRSETASVEPVISKLPHVTDLRGEAKDGKAVLDWSEPDFTNYYTGVTESFEDAEPFAQTYGDWIFVDGDMSPVGGIEGVPIPGIEQGDMASFFVFDYNYVPNEYFEPHSGTKFLASMFRMDGGAVDDWAISPELSGHAQTITFYAASFMASYPESIRMLYSTGGTNPDDFTLVREVIYLKGEWVLFAFDVPEGAKRFAIQSFGTDSFMLMLDDFTFESAKQDTDLELTGYRVYRNGERISELPAEERSYSDNAEGHNEYAVTAVYAEKGESRGSNRVELSSSGINAAEAGAISIGASDGHIVITGARGCEICVSRADGMVIRHGACGSDRESIPVASGVYLVKAGSKVAKIII